MVTTRIVTNAQKQWCRSKSKALVRAGKITKKPCSVCGAEKSEMHHPDYSKPEKVVWVCRKHHDGLDVMRRHGEARRGIINEGKTEVPPFQGTVTNTKEAVALIKSNRLENDRFSSNDIEKLGLFFWTKSSRQRVKIIKKDMFAENLLQAEVRGEGSSVKYLILGKNIIRFLKKYGDTFSLMK